MLFGIKGGAGEENLVGGKGIRYVGRNFGGSLTPEQLF